MLLRIGAVGHCWPSVVTSIFKDAWPNRDPEIHILSVQYTIEILVFSPIMAYGASQRQQKASTSGFRQSWEILYNVHYSGCPQISIAHVNSHFSWLLWRYLVRRRLPNKAIGTRPHGLCKMATRPMSTNVKNRKKGNCGHFDVSTFRKGKKERRKKSQ